MLNNQTNSKLGLLIVGDYLFEPKVGLLSGPSGAHHICPRMAALLSYLVEHSNEVVDRDYLISKIWHDCPQATQSLNQCVGRLRRYFDDTAKAANYIETIPNHGYRLVASVYGSTNKPVLVNQTLNSSDNTSIGARVYRLFQEFRDRKVCRSMLIYTMVIWLMFQVSEIMVPALDLPEWVNRLVVVMGLLGFPIAASLSWIFNLTPSGVVREPKHVSKLSSPSSRSWTDLALDSTMVSAALFICGMLVFAVWPE
jgi:DNA-binding winged helix-turn-helix (wHTH) protein